MATFSLNPALKKDSSCLQPVCGHRGETQALITPPRHVPAEQVGIAFSHEYKYKFLHLFWHYHWL